jgi:hypothetical protein
VVVPGREVGRDVAAGADIRPGAEQQMGTVREVGLVALETGVDQHGGMHEKHLLGEVLVAVVTQPLGN